VQNLFDVGRRDVLAAERSISLARPDEAQAAAGIEHADKNRPVRTSVG